MAVDQVALLAREIREAEESHPRDAQNLLDSLPVKKPVGPHEKGFAESVMDSVAADNEEPALAGEGPIIRALLHGLNWAAFVLAIGAVLFLTWAAGDGIVSSLVHR
jgi:hypothetical protein